MSRNAREFETECETKPEQSQRADSPAQRRDRCRTLVRGAGRSASRNRSGARLPRRPRHSLERPRQGCGGAGLERGGHVTQSRRAHVGEGVPKVTSAVALVLISRPASHAVRTKFVGLGVRFLCGLARLRRQGARLVARAREPRSGRPGGTSSPRTAGTTTRGLMGELTARMRPQGWKAWLCGVAIAGAAMGSVPRVPRRRFRVRRRSPATAGLRSVTVTYSPPASDGGASITEYRVACTSSDGGESNSKTEHASPTTVTRPDRRARRTRAT